MNEPTSQASQRGEQEGVRSPDDPVSRAQYYDRAAHTPDPGQWPRWSANSPLDIDKLRHPAEYSRLILAVTASIIAVSVLVLILVIAYSTPLLEFALIFILLLALAIAVFWLLLIVGRARMLGNSLLVSQESLPELQQVVDTVRNRVGYSRRVDIYVSDSVNNPVILATFMGTRVLVLEADMVAELQTEDSRPQLEFVLGSVFGTLKARHQQFILISVLLEFESKLKILNVFLSPYFRATVYTGDQIGAACCGSVTVALAELNRQMVGKELANSVVLDGVLAQAVQVRRRLLPRLGQLDATAPHLTNRYLNLLAFMAAKFPQEMNAYLNSHDKPSRELLAAINDTSVHGKAPRSHTAAMAVAAVTTVVVLALLGMGISEWRSEILRTLEPSPTAAPTQEPNPTPPEPTPTVTQTADIGLTIMLSAVPDEVEPCVELAVEAEFGQGLRELSCTHTSWDSLHYVQYISEAEMKEDYRSIVPTTLFGSDCRISPSKLTYNASTSYGVHDLSCYETQNGAVVFVWTSTVNHLFGESHLLSISTSASLSYFEMYSEWEEFISQWV